MSAFDRNVNKNHQKRKLYKQTHLQTLSYWVKKIKINGSFVTQTWSANHIACRARERALSRGGERRGEWRRGCTACCVRPRMLRPVNASFLLWYRRFDQVRRRFAVNAGRLIARAAQESDDETAEVARAQDVSRCKLEWIRCNEGFRATSDGMEPLMLVRRVSVGHCAKTHLKEGECRRFRHVVSRLVSDVTLWITRAGVSWMKFTVQVSAVQLSQTTNKAVFSTLTTWKSSLGRVLFWHIYRSFLRRVSVTVSRELLSM